MTSQADCIAQAVLSEYAKLPSKRKPGVRGNGVLDWVPISGIVAEQDGVLTCLALATGMKCLRASRVPRCKGIMLHDCHAEVLAIRTFNRYLLDECNSLLAGKGSDILERRNSTKTPGSGGDLNRPFRVKDNVKLHMYCSEAPCGDASMELIMAAQEDATPWPDSNTVFANESDVNLAGREGFSQLGVVRRKPGRRDASPTLSKSCSDKLALKQCTSLLSSLPSLFILADNAYISTLVVPVSQYSSIGFERSFSSRGRMRSLECRAWIGGFSFRPFEVQTTVVEFSFSKRSLSSPENEVAPSNMSTIWSASHIEETIHDGVLRGRKPTDRAAGSPISRRQMWLAAIEVARQLDECYEFVEDVRVYGDVKAHSALADRRRVIKDAQSRALRGWVKNKGDSEFTIES